MGAVCCTCSLDPAPRRTWHESESGRIAPHLCIRCLTAPIQQELDDLRGIIRLLNLLLQRLCKGSHASTVAQSWRPLNARGLRLGGCDQVSHTRVGAAPAPGFERSNFSRTQLSQLALQYEQTVARIHQEIGLSREAGCIHISSGVLVQDGHFPCSGFVPVPPSRA